MILMNSTEQSATANFIPDSTLSRLPAWGSDPAVLADIFDEKVNIATWQRTLSNELRDAVSQLVATRPNLVVSMSVAPDSAYDNVRELLDTQGRCVLSEDVAELVTMFCYLLGIKRAGLRLAVLDKAMCPKFHVDRVPCRLITTYQGAGTEWLPHAEVDRTKLGQGSAGQPDHKSGVYLSPEAIEHLRCGDVALMKGELWEGNEGAGLVHRSPAITNETSRLMLSLDVSD